MYISKLAVLKACLEIKDRENISHVDLVYLMEQGLYRSRTEILEFFNSHGLIVEKEALELILANNTGQMINRLITREVLEAGFLSVRNIRDLMNLPLESSDRKFEIYLPDIKVRSSAEDFRGYFLSRYQKIRKILSASSAMRGTIDIASLKKPGFEAREVKIVGMVTESSVTKNGHKRLLVEDMEDSIEVILMKSKKSFDEIILEDEVIGIVGGLSSKGDRRTIFANEIVRPDIPFRVIDEEKADPVYVASLSDIHVGSKTFRKGDFMKMINWLKASDNDSSRIKYLILSGDVVDGIGVYPGQDSDLEILDPMEQYARLSEYVNQVPQDISVFVMPGNHDIVRLAEPQPILPSELKKLFNQNVYFLPNPYNLVLENKNVLIYHGMSLNDMVELIPGMNFSTIGKAVEELLRRRHLAPKYGGKTPLIPSASDYHVIETVPDVFITGHVHSHAMGNYKGVRYVNSSTWQSQTEYQRMMNFSPNPSMLTLFDLKSKTTIIKDFKT